MNKKLILTSALGALLAISAAPVSAKHHEGDGAMHKDAALTKILKSKMRAEDAARDKYRNPAETLAFFQVKPDMTVAEYGPGGGWYTKVLAPYISGKGKYVAINADTSQSSFRDAETEARVKSWPQTFPETVNKWTGVEAAKIAAFESDEVSDDMKGKIDRILIFRSIHGMLNRGVADTELRALREALADDGMVGVVQHRAKEDATYEMSNGSKGFLRQKSVIDLFELNGFELVEASEINANPKDTGDYEKGVWTLPPVLTNGDVDKAKYEAIGESDRMTLLFKKRA